MGIEFVERHLTDRDRDQIQRELQRLPGVLTPRESYRRQRNVTLLGVGVALGASLLISPLSCDVESQPGVRLLALTITALLSLLIAVVARLWRDSTLATWAAVEETREELLGLLARGSVSVLHGSARAAVLCPGGIGQGHLVEVGEQELLYLEEPPHTVFELAPWPLVRYRGLGKPLVALTVPGVGKALADSGDLYSLSLAAFLTDPTSLEAAYQGNVWEDTVL